MRTLLPLAIAFGLLDVSLCLCQQTGLRRLPPPQTTAKIESAPHGAGPIQIHQLFFAQVAFEQVAHPNPQRPFIFQNDLTDAEAAIVNKVAADCGSKLAPLSDNPVVWESRLRFLESGEDQEDWRNQRLTELKARRDRVIVEHIEALRASLGEPRFQALETLIQDWYINSLTTVPATGTGKK